MGNFLDGFENCADVKNDDFMKKKDSELINLSFFDEKKKPFRALFTKMRRYYKLLSSIPEDAKMYTSLLTYDFKPSQKEFNKHIRKLIKWIEKKGIVCCPFFEYQVNRNYIPHWHLLLNEYIDFRLTRYWKKITGCKKVTVSTKKVSKEKLCKVANSKEEERSAVSAAIEYHLKVKNRDGEWVKLAPDDSRFIKYTFRNTCIRKFVDFYKPCNVSIIFFADGCNDKACELVLTRQDIKFDLNNQSNYYKFFRDLFFDMISFHEEQQNLLINAHSRNKNYYVFDKFFLKKGLCHIKKILASIYPYSLILGIREEAEKRKSQLINVYYENGGLAKVEFL